MTLNVALWVAGIVMIGVGYVQVRRPYARLQGLRATDENLRRYDSWRGGRRGDVETGVTGADVMRQQLRGQVRLWGAVLVLGVVLVLLGFFIR